MKKDDAQLTRDIAPFGLRMQADLKSRIQKAADRNGRSMNAEIVASLEEIYPSDSEDFGQLFLDLFAKLNELSDSGDLNSLSAGIRDANNRLRLSGHGQIQFFTFEKDGITLVGSQNVNLQNGLNRLVEAVSDQKVKGR